MRRPPARPVRLRRAATVLLTVAALAGCGGDDDPGAARGDQVQAAAVEAGLDDDVAAFLALAAQGQTATYQATYPGPHPDTQLVVANDTPDRRVDVVVDGVVTEVRLVVGGEAFRCVRDPDAGRITDCERTDAVVEAPGLFDDGTLDRLTTALLERADDFSFRVESTPIAGVEATCLVTQIRAGRSRPELGERGTICVSPQGALLRVDQAGEALEATDYTTDIPDDTFVRPDRDR